MNARQALSFLARVSPEPNSGCWLWTGRTDVAGYGYFMIGTKNVRAHRASYLHFVGEVAPDLVLDHKCRVRCCVNPDHLEPVTCGENIRRGLTGKHQTLRTHCPHGHEYAGSNLFRAANGSRQCRACHARREKQRRDRIRSAGQ